MAADIGDPMSDNERRIRLVFLVPYAGRGGAEVALENLLNQIPAEQFEVFLIAPEAQSLTRIGLDLGFQVHFVGVGKLPSTSFTFGERYVFNPFATMYVLCQLAHFAFVLRKWLSDNGIEMLYTSSMISHFIGAFACLLSKRKLIWHVHDIKSRNYALGMGSRLFGGLARISTTMIIVPSQSIAKSIRYVNKITVIPNGIFTGKFSGSVEPALRHELDLASDILLVGLVGRLTPWKGHRVFLEAVQLLVKSGYEFIALIVGGEEFGVHGYYDELQKLVDQLGIREHVAFTGFRHDIPGIMNSLDIVVVPSIRPEPFGLVIVEAMASGKPVVASNAGGPPEIILNGETGILFEIGNSQSLANSLKVLLDDPILRQEFGRAGRKRAESKYNIERYGESIVKILRYI